MLSFLDTFFGYHQIPMFQSDEEKTTFVTPHGLYCYKVIPFGLKNFLGFMVTQKGIEINSAQIKVVLETPTLSSKKELQRLVGHLVALGHFIAHFMDKLKHFFLTLRGIQREYELKDEHMSCYLAMVESCLEKLDE
ncbi:hypothetical protein AAG906_014933 [Vitis piasezkii]